MHKPTQTAPLQDPEQTAEIDGAGCGRVDSVVRCRSAHKHTTAPTGYVAWFDWAERMGKTHTQVRCPDCGRFAIWVPKDFGT